MLEFRAIHLNFLGSNPGKKRENLRTLINWHREHISKNLATV
jgi:hypothetical protein